MLGDRRFHNRERGLERDIRETRVDQRTWYGGGMSGVEEAKAGEDRAEV